MKHGLVETFFSFDQFVGRWPTFTLKGKAEVRTSVGALLSIAMMSISFLFALLKLTHLMARKNPLVNTFILQNEIPNNDPFRPHETNFRMAVALQDFVTTESKSDPRYVKWASFFYTAKDGIWTTRSIPIYRCQEADYEQFYPPELNSVQRVETLKKENELFCIDFLEADIEMWGTMGSGTYSSFEFVLFPC